MSISSYQPAAIIGHEGTPEAAPAFAYIIKPNDARDTLFLTSWEEDLTISGLPAEYAADASQIFEASQVTHGDIVLSAEFSRQSFLVNFPQDSAYLNELIVTVPSSGLSVTVLRLAAADLSAVLAWGVDTYIVQTGELEDFGIEGEAVNITCVPKALHIALGVPRLHYSRSCQHALFGGACGLTKASFESTGQMTPTAPRTRTVTVTGISGSLAADYFTSGTMLHEDSGEEFSIITGTLTSGTLVAVLGHYSDQFAADDEVKLYPGCKHTVADCNDKFANKVNFGGFPNIPNRNPTIHSA